MHVCTQICVCTTVSVCGERARDKNQRFFVLFCFSTTPYLRIWGRTLLGLLVKIKCRIWGRISHSACNSMAWLDSCVGQWTLGIWLVSIILWLLQTVQMCSTMLWFYLNPGYTNLSSCVQASYSLSPTHFRHYIFFLISKAFLFFLFLNYYSLIFFYSSVIIPLQFCPLTVPHPIPHLNPFPRCPHNPTHLTPCQASPFRGLKSLKS